MVRFAEVTAEKIRKINAKKGTIEGMFLYLKENKERTSKT